MGVGGDKKERSVSFYKPSAVESTLETSGESCTARERRAKMITDPKHTATDSRWTSLMADGTFPGKN